MKQRLALGISLGVILSTALLRAGDLLPRKLSELTAWFVWGGIAIVALTELMAFRAGKRMTELEETNASLRGLVNAYAADYPTRCRDMLSIVARVCRLTVHDRISVYRAYDLFFYMPGRFSESPDYEKRGRAIYRRGEGLVSRAFVGDSVVVRWMPKSSKHEAYIGRQERLGLPRHVTVALRMKSRAYVAISLRSEQQNRRFGVVVVESDRPMLRRASRVKTRLESELSLIEGFLQANYPREPKPPVATERGF